MPIIDDGVDGANVSFWVTLSVPVNCTLAGTNNPAAVTIIDDDDPVAEPVADLSSSTYSCAESNGTVTITVTLDQAPANSCSVNYATSNGTATQPGDYTSASGTLSFTSSDTSKTFDVTLIDDGSQESSETFTVTLSSPSGCTLAGVNSPATVTISDNDVARTPCYVDFDWSAGESGTISNPYNTFAEGLAGVSSGGTLKLKGDASDVTSGWNGTINQAVRIEADPAGPVRVGVTGGGS